MSEMTGLERLRELGREQEERSWSTVGKVRGRLMGEIARQIEDEWLRERLAVERVASEMELHFLGVEGMEDSPVARWARDLRAALGGHVEEVADVATIRKDAYDAYEWVCEHGGLDAVKRRWECLSYYADPVPRSCMEKRLARLQRQIDESHAALRRRNGRIAELERNLSKSVSGQLKADAALYELQRGVRDQCMAFGVDISECDTASDMLHDMNESLSKRLMPEGMVWPCFEDGEPVKLGEEAIGFVRKPSFVVDHVTIFAGGEATVCAEAHHDSGKVANFVRVFPRDRVKRPAPKVLDADGAEIRVGDTVWSTVSGDRQRIEKISQSCDGIWAVDDDGITSFFERPRPRGGRQAAARGGDGVLRWLGPREDGREGRRRLRVDYRSEGTG